MRAFLSVLRLELRRLLRSRTAHILVAACAAWMFAVPYFATSDGTAEGARVLCAHISLGGVFAISCIALAVSGAGSLSREREESRLALSRVCPESRFSLALGRIVALVAVGAVALGVSCAILYARTDIGRTCDHVIGPTMISPAAEAEIMYERYHALLPKLDEPDAPPELVEVLTAMTNTSKAVVLRMFTQKAMDRYETVATNSTATWRFNFSQGDEGAPVSVRIRFASDFNLRDEVRGVFSFDGYSGCVSNITKSVLKVPLAEKCGDTANTETGLLIFENTGANTLMLRPRRDIKLLVPADSFRANICRAFLQMISMLAAICAFAVFLGSCLGRTVAIFSCMVMLFVGAVSSDVIASYPDQLESDRVDRISLAITRMVELASRPLSSLNPIDALSNDECIESLQTLLVVMLDGIAIPVVFSLLCALAISRKTEL